MTTKERAQDLVLRLREATGSKLDEEFYAHVGQLFLDGMRHSARLAREEMKAKCAFVAEGNYEPEPKDVYPIRCPQIAAAIRKLEV